MIDQSVIMASGDRWSIIRIDDWSFSITEQADMHEVNLLVFTYFADRALKF